jgi:dimethylaniline monooxygenase (N-oxide forming)
MSHVFMSGHPFKSLKLLNAIYMKIPASAQYRIFGEGKREREFAIELVLRVTGGKTEGEAFVGGDEDKVEGY